MPAHGYLRPPQVSARDVMQTITANDTAGVLADWRQLTISICIHLAECQGYIASFNDNFTDTIPADVLAMNVWTKTGGYDDTVATKQRPYLLSRDVGAFQISIDATKVGTTAETNLYDLDQNVLAMLDLYSRRGWQPWAAYNSKVYLHDTYVNRACRAVGNATHVFMGERQKEEDLTSGYEEPLLGFQWWITDMLKDVDNIRELAYHIASSTTNTKIDADAQTIQRLCGHAQNVPKHATRPV